MDNSFEQKKMTTNDYHKNKKKNNAAKCWKKKKSVYVLVLTSDCHLTFVFFSWSLIY